VEPLREDLSLPKGEVVAELYERCVEPRGRGRAGGERGDGSVERLDDDLDETDLCADEEEDGWKGGLSRE